MHVCGLGYVGLEVNVGGRLFGRAVSTKKLKHGGVFIYDMLSCDQSILNSWFSSKSLSIGLNFIIGVSIDFL